MRLSPILPRAGARQDRAARRASARPTSPRRRPRRRASPGLPWRRGGRAPPGASARTRSRPRGGRPPGSARGRPRRLRPPPDPRRCGAPARPRTAGGTGRSRGTGRGGSSRRSKGRAPRRSGRSGRTSGQARFRRASWERRRSARMPKQEPTPPRPDPPLGIDRGPADPAAERREPAAEDRAVDEAVDRADKRIGGDVRLKAEPAKEAPLRPPPFAHHTAAPSTDPETGESTPRSAFFNEKGPERTVSDRETAAASGPPGSPRLIPRAERR